MNRKILLALLVLAFAGYAGWSFVDSVTPYVGVAAAQKAAGNVQVKGVLARLPRPPIWRTDISSLQFRMKIPVKV